jgi:hypothetical protein
MVYEMVVKKCEIAGYYADRDEAEVLLFSVPQAKRMNMSRLEAFRP